MDGMVCRPMPILFLSVATFSVWAHIWRDMKQVAHETLLVRPSTDVFHSKCPSLGLAAVATRLKHDFGTRSLRPAAPCLSFNAPGRTQLRSSRAA
ncbi:uncharacterized protein EV420DRAFT_642045 [Desarmillaria tabescens]|uniref:Uncharacterized protein n=1 Tax=Armillaria tabescens TaxID=1929756 RepID=A0AA39NJB9_ARMTA|nr:uncharacterized protein EV420DRAFT_642045 [Desarmillaria tabescens]KAK0466704.1 hypothetical protein EV420DRAFT_642045 [Desarmillaria tabescens]